MVLVGAVLPAGAHQRPRCHCCHRMASARYRYSFFSSSSQRRFLFRCGGGSYCEHGLLNCVFMRVETSSDRSYVLLLVTAAAQCAKERRTSADALLFFSDARERHWRADVSAIHRSHVAVLVTGIRENFQHLKRLPTFSTSLYVLHRDEAIGEHL